MKNQKIQAVKSLSVEQINKAFAKHAFCQECSRKEGIIEYLLNRVAKQEGEQFNNSWASKVLSQYKKEWTENKQGISLYNPN